MGSTSDGWLLLLPDVPSSTEDLAGVAENVFFHLWRVRMEPFTALRDGDTVYLVDARHREVTWELRAQNLVRVRYDHLPTALEHLRRAFGLFPEDLSDYVFDAPDEGWLLAWATEVVAPIGTQLPKAIDFGKLGARHGYLRLDRIDRDILEVLALPPGGRRAVAEPVGWSDSTTNAPELPHDRYVPAHIRREVWARDGGRCCQCGTDAPPMHVDHRFPFAKGGGNDLDNLQLLCRRHNLEKAARVLTGVPRPASADPLRAIATELGVDEPRADLEGLVGKAQRAGRSAEIAEALRFELAEVSDPLDLLPAISVLDSEHSAALRADLAVWLLEVDPSVALSQAAALIDDANPQTRALACYAVAQARPASPEEQAKLYRLALEAEDPWIVGSSHLMLSQLAGRDEERQFHLEMAAALPDPTTRGEAALQIARDEERKLLRLTIEDMPHDEVADHLHDVERWYRRALVSPDDEVFGESALRLARLIGGERGRSYARHAAKTENPAIRKAALDLIDELGGQGG